MIECVLIVASKNDELYHFFPTNRTNNHHSTSEKIDSVVGSFAVNFMIEWIGHVVYINANRFSNLHVSHISCWNDTQIRIKTLYSYLCHSYIFLSRTTNYYVSSKAIQVLTKIDTILPSYQENVTSIIWHFDVEWLGLPTYGIFSSGEKVTVWAS